MRIVFGLVVVVPTVFVMACAGTPAASFSDASADASVVGVGAGPASAGDLGDGDDDGDDASLPEEPRDARAVQDEASAARDAGPPQPPFDASDGGICARALAPGDLVIDELMIASVAGTGDHGEWIEVASLLDCAIDLQGLHGDCPVGARVSTFDVTNHVWLPARGMFVVADSSDPVINHDLPGIVVPWLGEPGDVLRNKGGTVTLRADGAVIASVTYPALKWTVGASIELPRGLPQAAWSDWAQWQTSRSSWFPGFFGTPNAPNEAAIAATGGP